MASTKRLLKKILLSVAVTSVLAAGALVCGCGDNSDSSKKEIDFDVQEEVSATYGTYFIMEDKVGVDGDGRYYFPKVTVSDSVGNTISVENGKFFVSAMGDYTITYELEYEGKNIVKTTTIKVADKVAPVISLAVDSELAPLETQFEIPAYDVSDDYDKISDITIDIKVTYNDEEVTVIDNKFILSAVGDYLIEYTAEDGSGNKTSKTFTVSAVNETDNVSYFNHPLGVQKLSLMNYLTESEVSCDTQKTFMGESTLKVDYRIKGNGGATVIFLDSPFITDISQYKYLYFYVYTSNAASKISFNNNFVADTNLLNTGGWQRILLEKSGDTFRYADGDVFYTAQEQAALYPANMNDITKFGVQVNTIDNTNAQMWFSTLRVAEELPKAEVDFSSLSFCFPDREIILPTAEGTGYIDLKQKVFVKAGDSDFVEIISNAYVPTDKGVYKFRYDLYDGDRFVESIFKKILVEETEAGVFADFNKPSGEYIVSGTTGIKQCNISTNAHLETEDSALYVEFEGFPSISITSPAIINLNEKDANGDYMYNYFMFYAFTSNENTKIIYQAFGADGDYYVSLQPNVWTPVIAYRKGDTFVLPNGKDIFASGAPCAAENTVGFSLQFFGGYEGQASHVYISTIRASKDFPLIEGDKNVVASALDMKALNPYSSIIGSEQVYDEEKCSLKVSVSSVSDASWQLGAYNAISGSLAFENPAIKDISAYKYLYFYVYTDSANLRIYGTGSWDYQINVTKGQWTLVCLERGDDGSWRFLGTSYVVIASDKGKDLTGVTPFYLYFAKDDNGGETDVGKYGNIYISAVRVSNEKPQ